MKQLITCIFLLAFALQTFHKVFMVVDYVANTKAFAENCENKARPQLHCNGQCILMKKLKKEEKKEEQNPERKAENKDEILVAKSFDVTLQSPAVITIAIVHPTFSDNRQIKMPRVVFHPPA